MSFSAYPEYCASSIDYLGALPEHWWTVPLKRLATVRNGRDYKEVEEAAGPYPVIGSGGEFARASTYLYSGNSVLFGRKGTVDRPLLVSGSFWTVDTMFYTEVDRYTDPRYLFYAGLIIPFGRISTNTALPSVAQEDLSETYLPQPPLAEQTVIADFLDHETARIDALIEEQQKLETLLKEKRLAIIADTVTKGLDPTAPFIDSGIEHLGSIPHHWRLPRLRYLSRIFNGSTPDKSNPSYWEPAEVPWVASGDLSKRDIHKTVKSISDLASRKCGIPVAPNGSVLIGLVGQGRTRGLAASLRINAHINQNVAAVVPRRDQLSSRFLFFALEILYPVLREMGRGGQQAALNCEIAGDVKIPLPSIDEQLQIVEFIDWHLSHIAGLLEAIDNQVQLLSERRSALISAVVTGKIDVREWDQSASSTEQVFPEITEKGDRHG